MNTAFDTVEDARAKALELRRQGLSYEHIAARIGRCAMTVYYWINGRPSQSRTAP